jgi:hypothetical protein
MSDEFKQLFAGIHTGPSDADMVELYIQWRLRKRFRTPGLFLDAERTFVSELIRDLRSRFPNGFKRSPDMRGECEHMTVEEMEDMLDRYMPMTLLPNWRDHA